MNKQMISVTRALVELKRLNDRIYSAITSGVYVATVVGANNNQKVHNRNQSVSEVTAEIKGSYQKVSSLIKNRENLKSKIVMSNATTKVKVLGREMSVAEAIELKGTVEFRKSLMNTIRQQYMVNSSLVERNNAELDASIERLTTTALGSDKTKVDSSALDVIVKSQKEQKMAVIHDPENAQKHIKTLEDEISVLESEIDFVLSESNASTQIEVEVV